MLALGEFLPLDDIVDHVPLLGRDLLKLVELTGHEVVLAAVKLHHLLTDTPSGQHETRGSVGDTRSNEGVRCGKRHSISQ